MASRTEGEVARKVAQNFVRTYGRPKFLRLIEMFRHNEPGPKIAAEFDVTRQRVHQWKTQLGHERTTFELHTEVETIVGPSPSRKMV